MLVPGFPFNLFFRAMELKLVFFRLESDVAR
jgi:hypothetical protein